MSSRNPNLYLSIRRPVRPALLALAAAAGMVLPLMIGFISATLSPSVSLQGAVLCGLVFPAFLIAVLRPKLLVAYTLLVWAVSPELRRLIDWSEGTYHSVSLVSLAPLLAGAAAAIPVMAEIHKIHRVSSRVMMFFIAALGYGSLIGLAKNGMGSIYDLMNYIIPLLLIPYFAVLRFSRSDLDRMLRAFANLAVLVAAYGIIQYLTVPAWDAFWMDSAGMMSIGKPIPLEIRVFSSLNSPGPAATFLTFALVPMILEKRWRGALGWLGVLLVVVALLTTLVRASWLILIVMLLVYIGSSSSKGKWKTLLQILFVAAALFYIVPKLPGAEGLTARMETLGSIKEDRSYNDRLNLLNTMVPAVMGNPVGQGIGSVGQSTKLGNGGELGEYGIMDNGFIALFLTFGLAGGLLFFGGLGAALRSVYKGARRGGENGIYARLALAAWAGAVASLISDNGFPGMKGYLVWMLVGLGLGITQAIDRKEGAAHAATER
ncbi:hypothetical protein F4V43_10160 [Paenibacillus spiritus]|uniref:O-antigen ligase-related domain-containing protein n=1 Tax=Paenibacillus spiritus TaxID=2496557 RepID=A0A5J5G9H7_9BACL|nr:O-antigen ligase family protein [Paenibacillus spiritus]KAA9004678.1 hypothetical protein F4V43_10160 [Paenibacillus spiritus]